MSETTEPKVMHEWTLAGYHSRIVETQPGIVTSEQAMDDDKLGRLWLPKIAPMGWQNEMIHLAAELARLGEENTHLRAALAMSKDPCLYCQLPAEEMAKCRAGFPGCARADDMAGCPEFGSAMEAHDLRAELARLSALVPRWVDPKQREPERYVAVQSVVEREGTGERKVQCLWLGDDADDFNPHRVMWMESADDPLEGWKVIAWLEVPIPPLPGTETP